MCSKRITFTCAHCGATFTEYRVNRRGTEAYCSHSCAQTAVHARKGQQTSTCEQCGVVFPAFNSHRRRFCSQLCAHRARSAQAIRDLPKRLWASVDRSGDCWVWTGLTNAGGYGSIRVPERGMQLAHRVAWELTNGPIPPGVSICHRCDNRLCCNPDHLFLGSHTVNMRDAATKGRLRTPLTQGEASVHAKLTADDVRAIRSLYAAGGVTNRELAVRFGVSQQSVSDVVQRKSWRHIE